jgi:aspartate dehydrogenase
MFHFMKLGVVGFGAVADEIVRSLEHRGRMSDLAGICVRPERALRLQPKASGRFPVVGSIEELLALAPDIVIEAAGHAALGAIAPAVLDRSVDLLIASVGLLADDPTAQRLTSIAPSKIWIAAGAVAGLDGLLAAKSLGPRSVKYTSIKPPAAWIGTRAEQQVMASPSKRLAFFTGNARQAAAQYPRNANVAATIALACLGLDRTDVELVSDPAVDGPLGIIEAEGDFGRFRFDILALASPSNPKSSALTGHSLVSAAVDGMRFRPF